MPGELYAAGQESSWIECGPITPMVHYSSSMESSEQINAALEKLRSMLESPSDEASIRLPPERQLVELLGVGRRTIRVALDILEKEGLIWRKQGQGTFGGQPAPLAGMPAMRLAEHTNPLEVMDVRIEIEPALARMAAARATPALIQQLERLALKAEQSTDAASWERWDSAFHAKIADASGSQLFIAIMAMINGIRQSPSWRQFRARIRSNGQTALSIEQHAAILDAIRRLHPLDAEAAMRAHVTSLRDAVIAEIGGGAKAGIPMEA
ncbi:GntR family transcriptional regulator [Phyllobacterium leguminum]|uniref:GntR family transcriptional regulator n=2 Tax=Phyllobacterium leguminum TaxID=314237 RepID=A0A318T297_9HYPH|nr:GntR family transcriptional regulator [Phyllobacterium leguminum]